MKSGGFEVAVSSMMEAAEVKELRLLSIYVDISKPYFSSLLLAISVHLSFASLWEGETESNAFCVS